MNTLHIFTFIFGALSIALGAIGFLKAKSKASLIAGSISGILVLIAGYLMLQPNAQAGKIMAAVVTGLLLGRFLPNFLKTKKVLPSGIMSVACVIEIVLLVLFWAK
jgi:uncharacterized membrane protein (UPF0136 family)